MSKKRLDDSWKGWLRENIQRKCDAEELLGILLKAQFSVESIRENMGVFFPSTSLLLDEAIREKEKEPDFKALASPLLLKNPHLKKVETDKVQIYTLDGFMTPEECAKVEDISNQSLRASTITVESPDKYFRTSRTCDLGFLNDPFVHAIDDRISRTLGIRLPYSEENQAQRYEVGQEFKAHTDFLEPGTDEYMKFASKMGNRTWTFMVYLNEGMKGGGTKFFNINKIFTPKLGQAVIWNNLYDDGTPNRDTLHSGMPVEEGYKMIITKWFREKGLGPMFHDA